MKKLRFIVAFLCLWMLLGNRNVFADTSKVNLTVGTVTAGKEDSVTVPISISDNHGICGASISVTYDKALTLTGIQGGDGLSSLTMTRPGDLTANPVIILWDGVNADTSNGNIALLTFKAPETEGNYPVTVSYEDGDIVDGDLNAVELNIINGSINVAGEGEHKHNFTSTITQKPTCTEKGVKTYTCTCGESYTEEIEATGHGKTEILNRVEPTYEKEGYTGDTCCSICKEILVPGKTIPRKENEVTECDKNGHKGGKATCISKAICEVCGKTYGEVDPDNHTGNTEIRDKKDATTTEPGYTGDVYCSDCGAKLSEGTEIPMLNPEDETIIKPNAFSNCADLVDVNIKDTVTEIGDEAFADCQNLTNIYFYGNCPKFGTDIFKNVKATAYYPYADSTWILDKLQGYGGEITWIPWNPETKEPAKRDLSICVSDIVTSGYTYNGEAQTPKVTLKDGDYTLEEGKDYQISCKDNTDAGTASFTITGDGNYGGSLEGTFLINKAEPVLKLEKETIEIAVGDFSELIWKVLKTDGSLSRSVEDEDMAWVSNTDLEEGIYYSGEKAGTVKVIVTAEEGRNYLKGSTSFTLNIAKGINKIYADSIVRNYSSKKQYITTDWISDGNWEGLNYTSNSKYVKINNSGKITIAKGFVGQATITVKVTADENYYANTKKVTVTVKPAATGIYKVTNNDRRKATVTWKKNTTGNGYVIQYSRNKSFKSGVKTVYVKSNRTTKATLSVQAKGKTYYVRIATYKTVGKNKILSSWSKAKSVKIRK